MPQFDPLQYGALKVDTFDPVVSGGVPVGTPGPMDRFLSKFHEYGPTGIPEAAVGMGEAAMEAFTSDMGRVAPGAALAKKFVIDPAMSLFERGRQAFGQKRYPEAAGYVAASAIPVAGPMLAEFGEMIGEEDIAGAAGTAAGFAATGGLMKGLTKTVPKVKPAILKAAPKTARLFRQAAERNLEQVLGATTKKLKAVASEDVVPGIIERGIVANTRNGLAEIANRGVEVHGATVDNALQAATQSGVELPVSSLVGKLEKLKGQYRLKSKKTGVVTAERESAIRQIQEVQDVLQQYGKTIRPDDLVELRRFIDDEVAKKKMAFLVDDTKGFEAQAQEGVANELRASINDNFPDLAAANNEYSFYRKLQTVTGATQQRTASQSGLMRRGLKVGVGGGGGAIVGGAPGAVAGAAAEFLHDTPFYRMRAAILENKMAERLDPRLRTAPQLPRQSPFPLEGSATPITGPLFTGQPAVAPGYPGMAIVRKRGIPMPAANIPQQQNVPPIPYIAPGTTAERMGRLLPERTAIEVGPVMPGYEPMVRLPRTIIVRDPKTGRMKRVYTSESR